MTRPSLLRSLTLTDATLLVVGCIVGVGIFRTAAPIAGHVSSPLLTLLLWVVGGAVSLCGALCYAELAAMFPASGGDYLFITRTYGRFWGFLFGWTKVFIERTGTIAILGFVFAEYFSRILPYDDATARWVGAGAVLVLTTVNAAGLRWGALVQNCFTVLKILALTSLAAAGISAVLSGDTVKPSWAWPNLSALDVVLSLPVAFVFVLWTYGGWTEAAYVADEVRKPTKNVPRAIIGGVLLTTALYLLVNWAYLLCVTVEALPGTKLVAAVVMQEWLGPAGGVFMAWMIACSAFGALNGYILTSGRVLYALGKDHRLFRRLSAVHPEFHTPAAALWVNAALAAVLVFTKTFDQIMVYSTVVITVFFILGVWAVVLQRRKNPKAERPYRAWGYPWTALVFVAVMSAFVLGVWIKEPREALFGFAFLALGVPLYLLSERLR